jgi:hypothetical protein
MRTAKRYTNQTFTKRVDHEGGEHREEKGMHEPTYCRKCGVVYQHRRWALAKGPIDPDARFVVCPACEQIAARIAGGYVTLIGPYAKVHCNEIDRVVRNEAERAAVDNPLSRIIETTRSNGQIVYETTTEHLAQRLGHAIERAFGGSVDYDFSHENKVVRVTWTR